MSNDFLRELGHLGVTARLKRLSNSISYSIRFLYQEQGLDIEPSWHLIFLWLEEQETSTMTEIATALQYSQAAITKILSKMKTKGYIELTMDPGDQRRKLISLSPKAQKHLPQFKKVWAAGQRSIAEMLEGNMVFLQGLTAFEDQQQQQAFANRALKKLSEK
ncbi:MAG: MarR family transcriptional regulator [Cyanothece sp. SIO1E1]|nr:MarR family transcriptional regulator [Cyanothece sp. SIO1E1]